MDYAPKSGGYACDTQYPQMHNSCWSVNMLVLETMAELLFDESTSRYLPNKENQLHR